MPSDYLSVPCPVPTVNSETVNHKRSNVKTGYHVTNNWHSNFWVKKSKVKVTVDRNVIIVFGA